MSDTARALLVADRRDARAYLATISTQSAAGELPDIELPIVTERERLILRGAVKYGLSDTGGEYYQLGGHGCVPVRFHPDTLCSLQRRGLLVWKGYWAATNLGRMVVAELL